MFLLYLAKISGERYRTIGPLVCVFFCLCVFLFVFFFLGGGEQMLGPSLCSRKKSQSTPWALNCVFNSLVHTRICKKC